MSYRGRVHCIHIRKSLDYVHRGVELTHIDLQAPVTDEDYDFPAASSEAHEWEEYDEPCPVLPNTGHLGPDQDYDDPVQRY